MPNAKPEPQPPRPPLTYILPTTDWAMLLDIIVREAPPGAVIEVHEAAMQALAEQKLQALGRQDVTVRLSRPASGRPPNPVSVVQHEEPLPHFRASPVRPAVHPLR